MLYRFIILLIFFLFCQRRRIEISFSIGIILNYIYLSIFFHLVSFIYIFSIGIIYIFLFNFNWYHFLQYLLIFFLYFHPFLTLSKGERNIGFWMIYCIICSFIYYSPKHILRGRNLRNFKIHQYMIEGEYYEHMHTFT